MLCCREARLASLRSTIWQHVQTRIHHPLTFYPGPIHQAKRFTSSVQSVAAPASPISSVTSINVAKGLPRGRQELHDALTTLKSRAGSYINLSQVELAIRGLESERAVIRIASQLPATLSRAKNMLT